VETFACDFNEGKDMGESVLRCFVTTVVPQKVSAVAMCFPKWVKEHVCCVVINQLWIHISALII